MDPDERAGVEQSERHGMTKPTRCTNHRESTFEVHGPLALWLVDVNPQSAPTQIQQCANGTKNPRNLQYRKKAYIGIDQSDLDPNPDPTTTSHSSHPSHCHSPEQSTYSTSTNARPQFGVCILNKNRYHRPLFSPSQSSRGASSACPARCSSLELKVTLMELAQ
jgi:hypothetical protein